MPGYLLYARGRFVEVGSQSGAVELETITRAAGDMQETWSCSEYEHTVW